MGHVIQSRISHGGFQKRDILLSNVSAETLSTRVHRHVDSMHKISARSWGITLVPELVMNSYTVVPTVIHRLYYRYSKTFIIGRKSTAFIIVKPVSRLCRAWEPVPFVVVSYG
jgi:hypothetical protein